MKCESNSGKNITLYKWHYPSYSENVIDCQHAGQTGVLYVGVFEDWANYAVDNDVYAPLQLFMVVEPSSKDAPMAKSPQEIQNTRQKAKTIKVTYNENDLDLCEGWNLVGNPFHAYLDFNALCEANVGTIADDTYVVYNADGFGKKIDEEGEISG